MRQKKNGKKQADRTDTSLFIEIKNLQNIHQMRTSSNSRLMIPMKGPNGAHLLCPDTGDRLEADDFIQIIQNNDGKN